MKKRRIPSFRRRPSDGADAAGVNFEDLPPDERSSEVVTHPGEGRAAQPDDDDTKPRPTLPASAVILHESPEPAAAEALSVSDDDYLFRPPADAEPGVDAVDVDGTAAGWDDGVPDVVVDADVREEMLETVGVSTFLEGPPGSGITTLLIERIVAELRSGKTDVASLALVARDAGAAALLRDRVRDRIEAAAAGDSDDVSRRRLANAAAGLRAASVGDGVALAAAMLRRWPEAAGVDPRFRVVSPGVARTEFEACFRDWFGGAGGDEPAVVRALSRGVSATQVHDIAEALTLHSGLVRTHDPHRPGATPDRLGEPEPEPASLRADSERLIGELVDLSSHAEPSDEGVVQIVRLRRWLDDAGGPDDDDADGNTFLAHFIENAPAKVRSVGSRANWDPPDTCAAQMALCRELNTVWGDARRRLGRTTIEALVRAVAEFADAALLERMCRGVLFPTDVVAQALALLARDADVRRAERNRHGFVAVDDVWDLDAPTLGLVLVLTSSDDDLSDPFALRPARGHLLVGGTPTTAVLRSRGADPRLVARMRERAMTPLRLQTSFRQAPALLRWTSAACEALLSEDSDVQFDPLATVPAPPSLGPSGSGDVDDDGDADAAADGSPAPELPTQRVDPGAAVVTNEIPVPRTVLTPEGHVMEVVEPGAEETPGPGGTEAAGPETAPAPGSPDADVVSTSPLPDPSTWGDVVALWSDAGSADPGPGRAAEAHAVAAGLGLLVRSSVPCVRVDDGTHRPPRWSDCAVILGSSARVEVYTDALAAAGVPHRREAAHAELFRRQEIQDLLALMRAALDPSDVVSTIAALRGLCFGCRDTDLVAAVASAGGPLAATAVPADGTPPAVATALQILDSLGEAVHLPALEFVDLALEFTGFEAATGAAFGADPAGIETLRLLAASWCGRSGGVDDLLAGIDAALRPLPATLATPPAVSPGTDAVTVLTVAEALGREFPVVAVANLHPLRMPPPVAIADHAAGNLHIRAGRPSRGFVTEGYEAALSRDDDEYLAQRTRLVCAALTRPRDKLLLALTSLPPAGEVPRRELVARVAGLLAEPDAAAESGITPKPGVTLVPLGPPRPRVPGEGARSDGDPLDATIAATRNPEDSASRTRMVGALGTAPDDPKRAALSLALSRVDFEEPEVAAAGISPEALTTACREAGAEGSETEVAGLLDKLVGTDIWARAGDADRVLRRPTVVLDCAGSGTFSDRLDLALVGAGTVVGIVLTLTAPDRRTLTRVALATEALARASGLDVEAGLVVDARTAETAEIDAADIAALVEGALD